MRIINPKQIVEVETYPKLYSVSYYVLEEDVTGIFGRVKQKAGIYNKFGGWDDEMVSELPDLYYVEDGSVYIKPHLHIRLTSGHRTITMYFETEQEMVSYATQIQSNIQYLNVFNIAPADCFRIE